MKLTLLAISIFLCFLPDCEPIKQPQQSEAAKLTATPVASPARDTAAYAILPFDSELVKLRFPGTKPAQLSEAELDKVDALLVHCVAELNQAQEKEYQATLKELPDLAINRRNYFIDLSTYRRQLLVIRNAKGEKEVWVNCFCNANKSEFSYWRKQEVSVLDGGNCFFNLKINLTTSTCYDVMVNGVA